jgi:hypothetical protein
MSPENQGVFQLLKEMTFRRILGSSSYTKGNSFSVAPASPCSIAVKIRVTFVFLFLLYSNRNQKRGGVHHGRLIIDVIYFYTW